MRILIAADIFPPQSGGPATYCVTLANELIKRGDEVKIVSLNPESDASLVSCSMYHVTCGNKLLKYLQYIYLLWKHAKGVDVIYAMGPVNAGLPTLIAAKLLRKKFVVKVVGDYAWEQGVQRFGVKEMVDDFQKKIHYVWQVRFLRKIQTYVVERAKLVIVPSEYLKKIVIGWGVKSEKIEVIYNAVEFNTVDPIKHDGERWLVSVGRLVPWKGMRTLIEIMPDLLKQFPDLKLKIVGSGPEMNNLRLKIKDLRLDDVVELVGELSRENTLSYISSADVFVLNSGYEGLSHVILEALSFGRPVLASNVGGNPELLNKESLFTYQDKEEIRNKIADVLNGRISVKIDRAILDKFKQEKMVEETKKVLCVS